RGDDRAADLLADRPDAARRLAALVALSSTFAGELAAHPEDLAALFELPVPERPLFPHRPHAELLRVAGAYAARELRVPDVNRRLAAVADGVVADALGASPEGPPLAVIGLGKLGAEELSFASDLDLMFVYEGEGTDDFTEANRVAERILQRIQGHGWEADADLRPEGRSGPLARSMVSYLEYW